MSEWRAERSHGPYSTGGVGTTGVVFSTRTVGLMSVEMAGLRLMDSSTSFAQSKGAVVQFVGSSSLVGLSSFIPSFA